MKTAAIDIETTGFNPDDELTVIGIDIPAGSRVFLNTDGRTYSETVSKRIETDFTKFVNISSHSSEREALDAFRAFTERRFSKTDSGDEYKFAAYNGETWNGGFDLPFIRTRCPELDLDWPLQGPYIDVMEVIGSRFNVTSETLETTYEELIGGEYTELDPFDDSEQAVVCWRDGEFEPLLRHNLTDIRRTRELAQVAERYCSTSHFSMRTLEPVN
ncbi:hypothetical protein [Halovenus marina]|uniref:hypothetical protein n=1 Tax=Halovenus marina TaxID=3396621 RepID=UPI003F563EF9